MSALLPILLHLFQVLIYSPPSSVFSPTQNGALAACEHPDYAALMALYNSTNGSTWTNNTNWGDTCDVCLWYGVGCDGNGRVIDINLNNNGLTGTLPPDIGLLTELREVDLVNNTVSGSIPLEIGNLTLLNRLDLSRNGFSGLIPVELGNLLSLSTLNLRFNNLSGNIPEEIGDISNLQFLILGNNQLDGTIPNSFQNLTNLSSLSLHDNSLSGSIPSFVGNFLNLNFLQLYRNKFSGPIPPTLGSLSNLINLRLEENNLSGNIPSELGNLSLVSYFSLSRNNLSGMIPSELEGLVSAHSILLDNNNLSGFLPPELSTLFQIIEINGLRVNSNSLEGCIPEEYQAYCLNNVTFVYNDNPCLWQESFTEFCTGTPCVFNDYTISANQNVICLGGSTSVQATGGGTYLWENGETTSTIIVNPSIPTWYSVTITTPATCTRIDSILIDVVPNTLELSTSVIDESSPGANDGSASVNVTGGNPAYTYLWSNGSVTTTISDLTPGKYFVSVTDHIGCLAIDSAQVYTACPPAGSACDDGNHDTFNDTEDGDCNCTGIPCPAIDLGLIDSDVSCFGAADGSAQSLPSGGQAPYNFLWSTGATTNTITALGPGDYQVTVTDATGCIESGALTINEPALLTSFINSTDESLPGAGDGSADFTVSGGTTPYSYLWSNGETTEDLSGLTGNGTTYQVTVTDDNGCSLTDVVTINTGCLPAGSACDDGNPDTFNDTEDGDCNCTGIPCPAIDLGLTASNVSCFGAADGSAQSLPSGGEAPYVFLWSTGATTNVITALDPGDYQLTVTDANGC
ncbi:MAG: hypothetical protein OEM26_18115, partial [Saprospiraceae bacterium]|nr:hypothetical protein [Saprospiraceae bacterium]